jgi:hypothetical protein
MLIILVILVCLTFCPEFSRPIHPCDVSTDDHERHAVVIDKIAVILTNAEQIAAGAETGALCCATSKESEIAGATRIGIAPECDFGRYEFIAAFLHQVYCNFLKSGHARSRAFTVSIRYLAITSHMVGATRSGKGSTGLSVLLLSALIAGSICCHMAVLAG